MSGLKPSSKVLTIAGLFLILLTLGLFQNCAQPMPDAKVAQQSSGTPDPTFQASYSPSSILPGTMVTINRSGGSPPYTLTKISGSGTLSENIFMPSAVGPVEIEVRDSKNRSIFVNFQVGANPGSLTITGNQTFTVPAGVTQITVKAWGAGGGGGGNDDTVAGGSGGGGAFVNAVLSVTPGQTFSTVVGVGGLAGASDRAGTGSGAGGGAGSGGAAGGQPGTQGDSGAGGGGGGGTFLYNSSNVIVLVAGGGGGGGGGGLKGGEGGAAGAGDLTGGGGGGGQSVTSGVYTPGSGATPGNSGDADRGTAGNGGGPRANGMDGRIVIRW
jgi:hypothetical protein